MDKNIGYNIIIYLPAGTDYQW